MLAIFSKKVLFGFDMFGQDQNGKPIYDYQKHFTKTLHIIICFVLWN